MTKISALFTKKSQKMTKNTPFFAAVTPKTYQFTTYEMPKHDTQSPILKPPAFFIPVKPFCLQFLPQKYILYGLQRFCLSYTGKPA
jgi:hypothetical protein